MNQAIIRELRDAFAAYNAAEETNDLTAQAAHLARLLSIVSRLLESENETA